MNRIQKFKNQIKRATEAGMIWEYLYGRLISTYAFKFRSLKPVSLPVDIRAGIDNYRTYMYLKNKYQQLLIDEKNTQTKKEFKKVVWWCWFQGEAEAPELAKICLSSVREIFNEYDVIVVTDSNLSEYIDIPQYIQNKYEAGIIRPATYSDIIRLLLLEKYGGVWIDSSVLCTNSKIKEILEREPFFVFRNDVLTNDKAIRISSWLISSTAHHPLIVDTLKMMLSYWEKENFTMNYFLIHLFFSIAADKNKEQFEKMPTFNNVTPHVMAKELNEAYSPQRFKELNEGLGVHKLTNHLKFRKKGTLYGYLKERYLGS